jgi:hypothetical protein
LDNVDLSHENHWGYFVSKTEFATQNNGEKNFPITTNQAKMNITASA